MRGRRAALPASSKTIQSVGKDFHELLEHFETVQKKHASSRQEALQNRSLRAFALKQDPDTGDSL